MAITEDNVRYGTIRINFTDDKQTGYKDVTKLTYMQNDILVNFLSGSRMTITRNLVKSIQAEPDVYVSFSENEKRPRQMKPEADEKPSKLVGTMVNGTLVPAVQWNQSKTFDAARHY